MKASKPRPLLERVGAFFRFSFRRQYTGVARATKKVVMFGGDAACNLLTMVMVKRRVEKGRQ